MSKSRIMIVDDSVVARRLVAAMIESDPSLELVASARSGRNALERLEQASPDLVILDVEMPDLNGIETLRILRERAPRLPVLMFSALTERAGEFTLDALALGAADYVTKPTTLSGSEATLERVRVELLTKIRALVAAGRAAPEQPVARKLPLSTPRQVQVSARPVELVVIGASTGGPTALEEVLLKLPADFPVPIVVVQHMPALFTRLFAERLDERTSLRVQEVRDGVRPRAGEVWIAPGGWHAVVDPDEDGPILRLDAGEPEHFCRPAVDVLFRSAAASVGSATLAVVLTGMGCDGVIGCRSIRHVGGRVLVQDEASSMIWGMPGAVANAGLADEVASLGDLRSALLRHVRHRSEDGSQVRDVPRAPRL